MVWCRVRFGVRKVEVETWLLVLVVLADCTSHLKLPKIEKNICEVNSKFIKHDANVVVIVIEIILLGFKILGKY